MDLETLLNARISIWFPYACQLLSVSPHGR